jgi:two-component system chemotaxis response regulator CheY
VLIVDELRATRMVWRNLMVDLGFSVREVANSSEALECVNQGNQVDLVLIDLDGPAIFGLESVRAMRKSLPEESLIIVATRQNSLAMLTQAVSAGASEYIMKPFTKEIIVAKLDLLGIEHK